MVRPTSISLEDQELEDLKLDAKAEGMNVSAYVRKIIRNRNTETCKLLPETGTFHQDREPIDPPKKELTAEEILREVEEKEKIQNEKEKEKKELEFNKQIEIDKLITPMAETIFSVRELENNLKLHEKICEGKHVEIENKIKACEDRLNLYFDKIKK